MEGSGGLRPRGVSGPPREDSGGVSLTQAFAWQGHELGQEENYAFIVSADSSVFFPDGRVVSAVTKPSRGVRWGRVEMTVSAATTCKLFPSPLFDMPGSCYLVC